MNMVLDNSVDVKLKIDIGMVVSGNVMLALCMCTHCADRADPSFLPHYAGGSGEQHNNH